MDELAASLWEPWHTRSLLPPPQRMQFLLVAITGWLNPTQSDVIEYLQEENLSCANSLAPDVRSSPTRCVGNWRRKPRPSDVVSSEAWPRL
jgi:hypothetical protein